MYKIEGVLYIAFMLVMVMALSKERVTDNDRGWALGAVGGIAALMTLWYAHSLASAMQAYLGFSKKFQEDNTASVPELNIRSVLDYLMEPGFLLLAVILFILLKRYATVKSLVFVLLAMLMTYSVMFLYSIIFPALFEVNHALFY